MRLSFFENKVVRPGEKKNLGLEEILFLARPMTVLVKRAGLLHSEGEGIETANVIGCLLKTGDIDGKIWKFNQLAL